MRNQSLTTALFCSAIRAALFVLCACLVLGGQARASYHLWVINEIYSNADGSIQFIELRATASFQNELQEGATLIARDTNDASNTFIFDQNLPDVGTFQRTMLLATPGFAALPGAVTPDFIIPTNFLFLTAGSLQYPDIDGEENISYADLPTDGVASLVRSLNNELVYSATNSPKNFANETGSVRPAVRIASAGLINSQLVFSFSTTSSNTYTIEATDSLAPTNWQTLVTFPGTGSATSITNDTSTPSQRYYRLRVD